MNFEAFAQLVRVMLSVKEEDFSMRTWRCGTTACMAGHACFDPWFRSEGLGLSKLDYGDLLVPSYGGLAGFEALRLFFDINYNAGYWLFGIREGNRTKQEVFANLLSFIATKGECVGYYDPIIDDL